MDKQSYSWQQECMEKWIENKGRGIVQAVTGSGKTIYALQAASELERKQGGSLLVRIVVPTSALLRQWNKALQEFKGAASGIAEETGFRGGGRNTLEERKYMIYVINSARYRLARQILAELKRGENVLLIADECHRYVSGENRLIFEFLPYIRECEHHFFSLGLSATMPGGQERSYLTSVLGKKKIVCMAEERTACAVSLIKRIGIAQKILIFGERISQAEDLYRRLQKYFPGKIGRCHSKMGSTANRNNMERFKNGEIKVLIACKSLDEGVDLPDVSIGVILSGTSLERQRIQRLGRIIRKKEEKRRASLYYLHIEETMEEKCFLPEDMESRIFDIQFVSGGFYQKAYAETAERVLEQMYRRGISPSAEEELFRCLDMGCVRADWQADLKEIEKRISEARGVRDKNYWICMKYLAQYYTEDKCESAT